jgi:hypothetical protein
MSALPAENDSSARYALNQPPIVSETIDGEVMVINLESGVYYSLTGAAAQVWPWIVAGASVGEIEAELERRHPDDTIRVRSDWIAFLRRLVEEDIVKPGAATGAAIPAGEAQPYEGFRFERFADMQALLVVDPVHEVGEFGWPPRPEGANPAS